MGSLAGTARLGSLEEFKQLYVLGTANGNNAARDPLLHRALGNHDPVHRAEISNFLLDDGADPLWTNRREGTNLLHILLTHVRSEFTAADFALLDRLLAGGADVNASTRRHGTPIQLLDQYANADESNVDPVYEVLFARDDLDLFSPGRWFSTYNTAWKAQTGRPVLWGRVLRYIADHGLMIPESEPSPDEVPPAPKVRGIVPPSTDG